MRRIVFVVIALSFSGMVTAQKKGTGTRMMKPLKGTVCYASAGSEFTTIGPPQEYLRLLQPGTAARTQAANIEVTYEGFTLEARNAFQAAVDIWESILETPVTIRVRARWTTLGQGVLGSASPGTYIANFEGAQKSDVWYPISLAEKIAGKELNGADDFDIEASFNSANESWYFGTGGAPAAGEYDLVSIVLHEIGHGLGITHAYSISNGLGVIPGFFGGLPVVFETNIQNSIPENMVNDFTPPSTGLKDFITSNNLFYASPLVRSVNSGLNANIYAPGEYSAGSSIAHLNETSYPAGNANSLMTPFIGAAERILDPGPVIKAILSDMGWVSTALEHTALKNTESSTGPYQAVVKVVNSYGYNAGSVTLNYRTTGLSFTALAMTPTGNADEFAADLPVGSSTYSYFISVEDDNETVFTNPPIKIEPGLQPEQGLITFSAGPDNQSPFINHTPKEFTTAIDGLQLEAIVSDNLDVGSVSIEWEINDIAQPDELMTLKGATDSTFELNLTIGGLNTGDKIEYRIRAEDTSVAQNTSYKPSPTMFYEVNVTGLGETQDAYANNFDNLSTADFFGNGFTISKPAGFANGAIHTDHPYAEAGEGASLNFVYNLKVPIRIQATEAIMKFDEIVLVEPGEAGIAWPEPDFYDYVVVEGSTDGGLTWVAVANGYDSRANPEWNSTWNSTLSDNNSTATGTPAMYKTHSFDLLNKFQPGDEVAFRFRLHSDPFSFGWGWSIDNLKIQLDDVPPLILHQHTDFILAGTAALDVSMKVTDNFGLNQIFVDYNVKGGEITTTEVIVNPTTDTYTQTIDLSSLGLEDGDEFQYRIRATDQNGNAGSFPSTDFIKAAIVSLSAPIDQLATDFDGATNDFAGNFFTVEQPAGFTSAGMSSTHPYNAGMDIDQVSEFSWMLKKAVKVSADNPRIYFEDVAIVQYFGTAVRDYVVLEASKDGVTWEPLMDEYAANAVPQWKTVFDNNSNGTAGIMVPHTIDITSTGKFVADDVILIRFRLHSDATGTGWGWFVDNLSIQGTVTGLESPAIGPMVTAWPNPVAGESLSLAMRFEKESEVNVDILTMHGQLMLSERFSAPVGDSSRDYRVADWPRGFYIVRVRSDFGTIVRKITRFR